MSRAVVVRVCQGCAWRVLRVLEAAGYAIQGLRHEAGSTQTAILVRSPTGAAIEPSSVQSAVWDDIPGISCQVDPHA